MTTKVLWLSGVEEIPSACQLAALRAWFGCKVEVDIQTINKAERQSRIMNSGRYVGAVAVMPFTNLSYLLRQEEVRERTIPLLYAESVPEKDIKRIEFRSSEGFGRRFTRFRVIDQIVKKTERIEPREIRLVARFSHNAPNDEELEELRRLFGRKVEVRTDSRRFEGANDIIDRMAAMGAEEVLPTGPPGVLRNLLRRRCMPLQADTFGRTTLAIYRLTSLDLTYRD